MKAFRTEKVGREIRQIVSEVIRQKLQDPRISQWTSVTRVEVSGDLEFAKVYVSVLGEEADQNKTLQALQNAARFVQHHVFKQLTIRQCPQISFHPDDSIKRVHQVTQLINESMAELERDAEARDTEADECSSDGGMET